MRVNFESFDEECGYWWDDIRSAKEFSVHSKRVGMSWMLEHLGASREEANAEVYSMPEFDIENGVLISAFNDRYDVEIPKGVNTIGRRTFVAANIDSVTLSDSVQVIDTEAFYASRVHTVNLNKNLRYIGTGAFAGSDIDEIFIPKKVTHIGPLAFCYCENLKTIYFEAYAAGSHFHERWRVGCSAKAVWGARPKK